MRKLLLLDSNIIIGIANDQIDADLFSDFDVAISVVTVMEVYALAGMSQREEKIIDDLINHVTTIPITSRIAKRAGLLTRTKRKQSPDLLIAATALELNIPLCTKNLKDFKQISGLEVVSF